MPAWLCSQLQKAFRGKNIKQIRLLNDCWYFYRASLDSENRQRRQSTHN